MHLNLKIHTIKQQQQQQQQKTYNSYRAMFILYAMVYPPP